MKTSLRNAIWFILALVCIIPFVLVHHHHIGQKDELSTSKVTLEEFKQFREVRPPGNITTAHVPSTPRCALCFFGLPRSFRDVSLPSILQNVLIPNKAYRCDIFVHYFNATMEGGHARSGHGGDIDPNQIYLLRDAVASVYQNEPVESPGVWFTHDTEDSFWKMRGAQINKYETTKDLDGKNYLYYPWMAKSYVYPTSMHNIVKQWHSIEAVWNLMESTGRAMAHRRQGSTTHPQDISYERVAMLRNDVLFVTPFDIFQLDKDRMDTKNQFAVIPDYARFPVNDRMIYGPTNAVREWSTQRFERLEDHARTYKERGYGMHSERFLESAVFPHIPNNITANPDLCFFRVRADGAIWITDCTTRNGATRGFRSMAKQPLVERLLGRPCVKTKLSPRITEVRCPVASNTSGAEQNNR